jgi:hypothetical protein
VIAIVLAIFALFLLFLAIGGALVDWLDPYQERREADRRNHIRRQR